jgi:hypothetical protein
MSRKLMYINKDNQLLNPNSFKRLNQNKNLSKSQLKLLRLERIFIKESE